MEFYCSSMKISPSILTGKSQEGFLDILQRCCLSLIVLHPVNSISEHRQKHCSETMLVSININHSTCIKINSMHWFLTFVSTIISQSTNTSLFLKHGIHQLLFSRSKTSLESPAYAGESSWYNKLENLTLTGVYKWENCMQITIETMVLLANDIYSMALDHQSTG